MSKFYGEYFPGAMRVVQEQKRQEANERNRRTRPERRSQKRLKRFIYGDSLAGPAFPEVVGLVGINLTRIDSISKGSPGAIVSGPDDPEAA